MKVDSARKGPKNTCRLINRHCRSVTRVKMCQHSVEPFPAMQHLGHQRAAAVPQVYSTTARIFVPLKTYGLTDLCNISVRMSGKKSRKDPRKVGKEEEAMMAALQKKTSLSATEIKEQHQLFKKICPQGLVSNCVSFGKASIFQMTKKQFLDNSTELLGAEGSFMAERLFKFDHQHLYGNHHHDQCHRCCHHHVEQGV